MKPAGVVGGAVPAGITRVAWSHLAAAGAGWREVGRKLGRGEGLEGGCLARLPTRPGCAMGLRCEYGTGLAAPLLLPVLACSAALRCMKASCSALRPLAALASCASLASKPAGVVGGAAPAGMTRVAWSHLAAAGLAVGRRVTGLRPRACKKFGRAKQVVSAS